MYKPSQFVETYQNSNMAVNSTKAEMMNTTNLNFSTLVSYDLSNQCLNMDCIFSRTLKARLPVLRPLTAMLILIGILGFIGNVFVILVYSQTRKKNTSTYLILMLAITDLIACGVVIPGTLFKEWFFKFKSDIVCKLWELLRNYAIISSATTLSVIAFDRFLLVYRNRFEGDSRKVTLVMILIIVSTGISLGIPPMLGVGVYIEDYGEDQMKLLNIEICLPNDLLISEASLDGYWQFVTGLFGTVIFTIIVLYLSIFILVYKYSDKYKGNNSNQQESCLNSHYTKSKWSIKSILPFAGYSKGMKMRQRLKHRRMMKRKVMNGSFPRVQHIFGRQKEQGQTVKINIISNTPSAEESTSELDNNIENPGFLHPLNNKILQETQCCQVHSPTTGKPHTSFQAGPSTGLKQQQQSKRGKTGSAKGRKASISGFKNTKTNFTFTINSPKPSTSPGPSSTSNRLHPHSNESQSTRQLQIQNTRAHVKTTQVLCIITTVYIAAFLPMFLIIHDVIQHRGILFYLYFINNAANPIIYSFVNTKFRQCVGRLVMCKKNQVCPV